MDPAEASTGASRSMAPVPVLSLTLPGPGGVGGGAGEAALAFPVHPLRSCSHSRLACTTNTEMNSRVEFQGTGFETYTQGQSGPTPSVSDMY